MEPMLGMIFMIPWSWAPNGYQMCQGQTLTIQQYEALFSLMATVFGGNGSTNFNLPNLQGRVPVGLGQTPGTSTYYTLAASGGSEAATLTVNNLPPHSHAATFSPTGGSGTPATASGAVSLPFSTTASLPTTVSGTVKLAVNAAGGTNTPSDGAALAKPNAAATNVYTSGATAGALGIGGSQTLSGTAAGTVSGTAAGNVTLSVTGGSGSGGTVAIANTGFGVPVSNMQPYLAMNFIIAVNGLYPDRP